MYVARKWFLKLEEELNMLLFYYRKKIEEKLGIFAGLILFLSLLVPWTVTWGTNVVGVFYSQFYIFEFPFMTYYVVTVPGGLETWWDTYEFVPRYLGILFMVIGGLLAFLRELNSKPNSFVSWGGVFGTLAIIFFTSCRSASITISYPVTQSYTVVPLGLFMPAFYWILILLYPEESISKMSLLQAPSTLYCGHCGRQVSPEFNVCPYCGQNLIKPVCSSCGRTVPLSFEFCPYCGAPLAR